MTHCLKIKKKFSSFTSWVCKSQLRWENLFLMWRFMRKNPTKLILDAHRPNIKSRAIKWLIRKNSIKLRILNNYLHRSLFLSTAFLSLLLIGLVRQSYEMTFTQTPWRIALSVNNWDTIKLFPSLGSWRHARNSKAKNKSRTLACIRLLFHIIYSAKIFMRSLTTWKLR